GSDSLAGVDVVVLPAGCFYGDYLRAVALSSFAPIMSSLVDAANTGLPVLGICNCFQILCETQLLAGAMIKNTQLTFVCTHQVLRVENTCTAWTHQYSEGEQITVPLKNQDGQFIADESTLDELEGEGRVVF